MCIAVLISAQSIERVFWSPDDLAIYVPPGWTLAAALPDIRAYLDDFNAPRTAELTCCCGEPITLPRELLEANRGTPTH